MDRTEIARVAHEINRAYCASLGDTSQPAWEDAPEWQQQSAKLNNALAGISETMRTNSSSFDAADQDSAALITRAGGTGPLNL